MDDTSLGFPVAIIPLEPAENVEEVSPQGCVRARMDTSQACLRFGSGFHMRNHSGGTIPRDPSSAVEPASGCGASHGDRSAS